MDVAWLILDSLSFASSPFAADGPETMPGLRDLASDRGVVFTEAYAPGPSSPSSHGSFFTNELPSTTGMHEASPYFDADLETIAGALASHESLLISTNPFVFNGLDRDFDDTDDLRASQYLVFPEATDPHAFTQRTALDRGPRRWLTFLLDGGRPIRSFVNGVAYKLWFRNQNAAIPDALPGDDVPYQYASTMNERIRRFLDEADGDAFVAANYMDVHPPFDASDEALARFAPDEASEDLPIQVAGQEVLSQYRQGDQETADRMMKLYRATIWDLDRKVTPLVEELLADDTAVFVTADHGNWFRRREEFETEVVHVPLLAFVPGHGPSTIEHTVSIRHLASTTMAALDLEDPFPGEDLLAVSADQLAVTESIHEPEGDSPVAARGGAEWEVLHDVLAIRGDARVEYVAGEFERVSGGETACDPLEEAIADLVDGGIRSGCADIDYDAETERRLEDLGYL